MANFVLIKRKVWERGTNIRQERNILNLYQNQNLQVGKNIFASHKHANSNSNAIGNNENLTQQTRNIFKKIAYFSSIVKQKPKNVVIFTDWSIAYLKPFPGPTAIYMNHHAMPILEEHQHDVAAIDLESMIC